MSPSADPVINHIPYTHHSFTLMLPYVAVLLGIYWLQNAWVAVLVYHLGILVLLSLNTRWSCAAQFVTGIVKWQIPVAALCGIIAGAIFLLASPLLGLTSTAGPRLAALGLTASVWPFFLGYFILVNPIAEELFWREYHGSDAPALIWSDAFFAGYHLLVMAYFVQWPWLIAAQVMLMATAWLFRQINRVNGGLFIPYIMHASVDAGILTVVFLFIHQSR